MRRIIVYFLFILLSIQLWMAFSNDTSDVIRPQATSYFQYDSITKTILQEFQISSDSALCFEFPRPVFIKYYCHCNSEWREYIFGENMYLIIWKECNFWPMEGHADTIITRDKFRTKLGCDSNGYWRKDIYHERYGNFQLYYSHANESTKVLFDSILNNVKVISRNSRYKQLRTINMHMTSCLLSVAAYRKADCGVS